MEERVFLMAMANSIYQSTKVLSNKMRTLVPIASSAILLISPVASLAGSYEALCGGVRCSISVSSNGIRSPQGSIPASRIAYWSVNGESSTSVGTGVATTILFGGIGLLGFLAKNHDFDEVLQDR